MFTDEQIFERLMKGENIDDIMAEITNKVNSAIQKKADADKAAEEAKRKAEEEAQAKAKALYTKKETAVNDLICSLMHLCELWGWDETANELGELTNEDIADIIETIDSYGEMMATYAKLAKTTFPLGGAKPVVKKVEIGKNPVVEVKKPETSNDIINKFLKAYGLR